MKLENVECPVCGAGLDMNINNTNTIFCPYCGSQLVVDRNESVTTKKIIIQKEIKIHTRYTDDADVLEAKLKDKQNERKYKYKKIYILGSLLCLSILAFWMGIIVIFDKAEEKKAISSGQIKVGMSSSDLEGKKYEGIKEKLEAQGFSNITLIDLQDADMDENEPDTIESVTINGDVHFYSTKYYDPDAKIIISYH